MMSMARWNRPSRFTLKMPSAQLPSVNCSVSGRVIVSSARSSSKVSGISPVRIRVTSMAAVSAFS